MKFNIGDIVRVNDATAYLFKDSPWRNIKLEVKGEYNGYVRVVPLENTEALSSWLNISSVRAMAGFPESELEAVKESNTMTFEEARDSKARIVRNLNLPEKRVRVRSRSWDVDGIYAGVDILAENGKTVLSKLYNRRMVDEYITENKTPTEVIGIPYTANDTNRFVFYTPDGKLIRTDDQGSVWTTEEVIQRNGEVEFNGKRYRLGKPTFAPFV